MKFQINHIEYEIEETNIKLVDFLKNNNVLFNNNNVCKVEIENKNELKNYDEIIIEDGMSLLTISDKIIDNLNLKMHSLNKPNLQDEIILMENNYNILLCDSDIYEACLKLYSNTGFNDIINIKFASMIECVEKANEMLNKKANELENMPKKTIVYSKMNVLNCGNAYNSLVLSDCDIAATLIKKYYKKICNIKNEINIIYITSSIYKYINNSINESKVNNTVLFNYVNLAEKENKLNNIISKAIYVKKSFDFTVKCSFIGYIKLFRQMKLKENRIESISLNEMSKKITGYYQGINIVGLISKQFPSIDEVSQYDYIYILDDTENLDYVNEEDYLNDYNINMIYKMFLDKPGNQILMRKK